MKRKSSFGMDKTQPALLVQHGNTAQKHRPLDRAAVTLGQARGCDIELDAPEVSTVHCIITRGPDGLFIRDCNSRMGTRVNGERIKEGYLHDADILQVGPFSFQVYVPPSFATQAEKAPSMNAAAPLTDPNAPSTAQMEQALAAKEAELQQQEEALQKLQTDLERQKQELEEGTTQLEQSHRSMQEENNKIHAHAQQWEKELEERHAKLEADIQARMEECKQKCAAMERAQAEALKQAKPTASQRQHSELIGVLGELHDFQKASREQQGQEMEMLRQTQQLLQALASRREQPAVPNLPPMAEPPQTPPPSSELKGRDKLVERLRAIDAKIPAVGSRQSRHD